MPYFLSYVEFYKDLYVPEESIIAVVVEGFLTIVLRGPTHARSGVGGQANIEILAGSSCMTGISPSIQYHKIYAIVNISLKSEIFQETSWPTGVTDAHQLRAGRFQRPSPSSWSWSWLS